MKFSGVIREEKEQKSRNQLMREFSLREQEAKDARTHLIKGLIVANNKPLLKEGEKKAKKGKEEEKKSVKKQRTSRFKLMDRKNVPIETFKEEVQTGSLFSAWEGGKTLVEKS